MIWKQYQEVEARLKEALQKADRPTNGAQLIAVSKTKPLEAVETLAAHGVTAFGENKVQELCAKKEACHYPDLAWHFIGHLQRNKVRQLLAQNPILIHSVDSERLALEIEKEAAKLDKQVAVLAEVNIGQESSKTGFSPEEVAYLLPAIAERCPHIIWQGLMCVAPEMDDMEKVRPYFRKMRELRDETQKACKANGLSSAPLTELSMGMTGDFPVAIEEGATMIRVGTAIFGARNYNI